MPQKIGPKRLQRLFDQQVDLHTLPTRQQFEAARTMARLITQAPRRTPKRLRPRCTARCRTGRRCQAKVVWDEDNDCPVNGRCRLHGGLSTGPRTPEGRRRIGMANRARAQARRLAQAQAAARAEALEAYQAAVALYEVTCQHPMPAFAGLKAAFMQLQGYRIELAYQRCLASGVDPRTGEGD
jgi:hypothetical protein